ncbi:MAG: hypothetical protein Ct9H300mP13_5440 [Gammaproteobacteria bacterium]|nr:MAG: hypothetical protein Ct9H300mP13_5440 [Gammaproteobacteria bacterium]
MPDGRRFARGVLTGWNTRPWQTDCDLGQQGISIDGEVDAWFTDNPAQRFRAYGWQVIEDVDGHDADSIATALEQAGEDSSRPTLLCCRTVIGWGSPNKQGRASSHGAPLGQDEVALVRETIDWPHAPFEVPEEITAAWCAREVGAAREAALV